MIRFEHALTVGMATILMAKKIILLVSGKNKSEPLKRLLTGRISTAVPATMLNLHRDIVIITHEKQRKRTKTLNNAFEDG